MVSPNLFSIIDTKNIEGSAAFTRTLTYSISITVMLAIIYAGNLNAQEPLINDPSLDVQVVNSGFGFPTGMAFLGQDDILVLEKDEGTVRRIKDGQMLSEPVLNVNVSTQVERGLLGIAIEGNTFKDSIEGPISDDNNNKNNKTYVYLYYTESSQNGAALGNRLYRYEFDNSSGKLVQPRLLLDLPAEPGPAHNGGVVTLGPDNNVYVIIGNLYSKAYNEGGEITMAQNIKNGAEPDGRGGILRVTPNGSLVDNEGILGDTSPLNKYYAYGIRNSFGITFDPVTGNLWETENGAGCCDEINLVAPGFNSGWSEVAGLSRLEPEFDPSHLVDFGGRGKYSDPEFVWQDTVAPTALTFFTSDTLGSDYTNDLFVGSVGGTGRIFHYNVDENRTSLRLDGSLSDKVADSESELDNITFATNLGTITDVLKGPDGLLYVLSDFEREGTLFRIVPRAINDDRDDLG
jgi:glucose/arabinose dehydrogenase